MRQPTLNANHTPSLLGVYKHNYQEYIIVHFPSVSTSALIVWTPKHHSEMAEGWEKRRHFLQNELQNTHALSTYKVQVAVNVCISYRNHGYQTFGGTSCTHMPQHEYELPTPGQHLTHTKPAESLAAMACSSSQKKSCDTRNSSTGTKVQPLLC